MDYDAVLAHVLALLQQEQRVAYRVLKRRLQLDDETLEDLEDDLIYAKKLAVDEDGRVLVWTSGTSRAPTTASPVPLPATPDISPTQVGASPGKPATPSLRVPCSIVVQTLCHRYKNSKDRNLALRVPSTCR
jgi:hypothetical protein